MLAYREWRNLNDEVIGSICRCCIGRYFFLVTEVIFED